VGRIWRLVWLLSEANGVVKDLVATGSRFTVLRLLRAKYLSHLSEEENLISIVEAIPTIDEKPSGI
jgi:hypothetical protein